MPTHYSVVCDDDQSREVRRLARENNLTEEEVLRQLVELGLESLEEETPV